MKLFTNLPGSLRLLFGIMRLVCALLGALWLQLFVIGSLIPDRFTDKTKLMVSVGEVLLRTDPVAVGLKSDTAKPGSLGLDFLRGNLQLDLWSKDADLVSALRWTMFPGITVFIVFSWVLFGSLRNVCANIERGEVFSENNLRLVRNVGITLIAYSLASVAGGLWAAHVMGGYLNHHVALTGVSGGVGTLSFLMPSGLVTIQGGLVTGLLVLVISEAFRQGLALKTENDLTV